MALLTHSVDDELVPKDRGSNVKSIHQLGICVGLAVSLMSVVGWGLQRNTAAQTSLSHHDSFKMSTMRPRLTKLDSLQGSKLVPRPSTGTILQGYRSRPIVTQKEMDVPPLLPLTPSLSFGSWAQALLLTLCPVLIFSVFYITRGTFQFGQPLKAHMDESLEGSHKGGPSNSDLGPSSQPQEEVEEVMQDSVQFPAGETPWERVLTSYAHGTLEPAINVMPSGGATVALGMADTEGSGTWAAQVMLEEALSPALSHLLPGQVISVMRALRQRGACLGLDAHAKAAVTIYRLGFMHADVHTLVATALEGVLSSERGRQYITKSDVASLYGDTVMQYVDDLQKMTAAEALMKCVADPATQGLSEEQYQLLMMLLTKNSSSAHSSIIFLAKRLDFVQSVVHRVNSIQQLQHMVYPQTEALVRTTEVLTLAEKHAAQLAMHVWAHLANALGLTKFKSDFEEMAFRLLHPAEHAEMHQAMDTSGRRYERILQEATESLKMDLMTDPTLMAEVQGIHVTGRTKTPYSVWKKMKKKNLKFHEVLDKVALRVVLDVQSVCDLHNESSERCEERAKDVCYRVRNHICNLWATIPEKNKDYVAHPKANGYQSLHMIAVKYTQEGHAVPIEVQIRSKAMDQQAEYGVAGHWQYKMVNGQGNAKETLKEACLQLFGEIDRDKSGVIDQDELALLLRRLGAPIRPEEVGAAMAMFDKDGNGVIDFEEFWTALHTTWFSVLSGDLGRSRVLA